MNIPGGDHVSFKLEGRGRSYIFFVKFQSEFIFSVYLKVNILEVEHVALDGKELVYIILGNIQNEIHSRKS